MNSNEHFRDHLFAYDANHDLRAETLRVDARDGITEERFVFSGGQNNRVPGVLVYTSTSYAPRPAVIVQHGLNAGKDDPRIDQLRRAWAASGFVCVTIDAPGHGERGGGIDLMSLLHRPEEGLRFVQDTVIDLRRMVDVLEQRPDIVAPGRVGYLGISMSTVVGVQFVAVEHRIRAACFALGGAGLFHALVGYAPVEEKAALERVAQLIDPLHYAGRIAPRPVLQVNGTQDRVIPPILGHMLHGALAEPKQAIWYDGGHDSIPLDTLAAMESFFARHLGHGSQARA